MKYRAAKWFRLCVLGFVVGPVVAGALFGVGFATVIASRGGAVDLRAFLVMALLGAGIGLSAGWIPALMTVVACHVMPRDHAFGYLRFFLSSNIAAIFVFGGMLSFALETWTSCALVFVATTLAAGIVWFVAKEFGLIVPVA